MTRPAHKATQTLSRLIQPQSSCAVSRPKRPSPRTNILNKEEKTKIQEEERERHYTQAPMTAQFASHGRGGAGNMADAAQSPSIKASDLETPVLKTAVVTTGRGGTGNMTKNNDPHETRLRQDVKA